MNQKTSQEPTVFSVSEITYAIKRELEPLFSSIWIQGEISNAKQHTSGHFYFSLKDDKAQIQAVMFRGAFSSLKKIPKDGDQVTIFGNLNLYPPRGSYQIVALELRFQGIGELLLKLEALKRKLHQKGWFSKERKKEIPQYPKKIGVITSPTGAVIQDILNILTRRFSGFHLILNPVKVQGDEAKEEIAQAIEEFNQHRLVDVIIVCRGGGSIEDLWAFNEEMVAEAIVNSQIPIIAAVGHETDHTIAEYVADLRAPTPSAAAELVVAEKTKELHRLNSYQHQIGQLLKHSIRNAYHKLEGILKQPALRFPYVLLGFWMQKLDEFKQTLDQKMHFLLSQKQLLLQEKKKLVDSLKPNIQIVHFKEKLSILERQIQLNWTRIFALKKERLGHLLNSLKAIDPKNLLKKGYAILFKEKDHSVITSIQGLEKNQKVEMVLLDGKACGTIDEITPYE